MLVLRLAAFVAILFTICVGPDLMRHMMSALFLIAVPLSYVHERRMAIRWVIDRLRSPQEYDEAHQLRASDEPDQGYQGSVVPPG